MCLKNKLIKPALHNHEIRIPEDIGNLTDSRISDPLFQNHQGTSKMALGDLIGSGSSMRNTERGGPENRIRSIVSLCLLLASYRSNN